MPTMFISAVMCVNQVTEWVGINIPVKVTAVMLSAATDVLNV